MSWNQFRRDRYNSGRRDDTPERRDGDESPPRPEVAWTAELEGVAADVPVLDRETVYVGTEEGAFAFDRRTGEYRWPFRTESAVLAPVRAGDALAIVTRDGAVYGLEAETGEQRWRAEVPTPVSGAPSEHDRRVFVGHAEGVTAFAIETGERLRELETGAETGGAPAVYDGRVYVGTREETVVALDLEAENSAPDRDPGGGTSEPDSARETSERELDETGNDAATDADASVDRDADEGDERDHVAWSAPIRGAIAGGPVIVPEADGGDRVYVADDGGLMLAMDAATGQSWFTYEIDDAFTSAPTVVDDAAFVAADDGYCHVTDTQFGTRKVRGWLFAKKGISLDGVATAEPALVGGTICLGDDVGSLYGIDVDELDFAWYVPLEAGVSAGPAVAGDGLYLGTDDGRLLRLAWDGDESGWR